MRRKLSFALAVTAAIGLQASLAQAAPNDPFCDRPVSAACANYAIPGFSSSYDCYTFYDEYCPVDAAGEGCYYDPRISQTVCL